MAETNPLPAEGKNTGKGGMMPMILAFVLVTAIGGGGGAALGALFGGDTVAPVEAEPSPDAASAEPAHGSTDIDHAAADDATIAELAEDKTNPLEVLTLKPVVTNLYNPASAWIRIEASLVFRRSEEIDRELLAAEIEADTLTFLRSLQIAQVEGPRGLLHLREDLRERARLRSSAVVDYLLTAMVVE